MQIHDEINELKSEIKAKKLELAKIMSTSGSDPAKTPAFSDTEQEIFFLEERIKILENTLKEKDKHENNNGVKLNQIVELKSDSKTIKIKVLTNPSDIFTNEYLVATMQSEIGKSLLNKKIGDTIRFQNIIYKITNIS